VTILHSKACRRSSIARPAQDRARHGGRPPDPGRALRARNDKLASPGSCCAALADVQTTIHRAKRREIIVPTYRLDRVRLKLRPAEGRASRSSSPP